MLSRDFYNQFLEHYKKVSTCINDLFNSSQNYHTLWHLKPSLLLDFFGDYYPDNISRAPVAADPSLALDLDNICYIAEVREMLTLALGALKIITHCWNYNHDDISPSPEQFDALTHIPAIAKDIKLLQDHPALKTYATQINTISQTTNTNPMDGVATVYYNHCSASPITPNNLGSFNKIELLMAFVLCFAELAFIYEENKISSKNPDTDIIDKNNHQESKKKDSCYKTKLTVFQPEESLSISKTENQNLFDPNDAYNHGCGFGSF